MSGIVRANNSGQSGAVSNIETIDSDDYVDASIDNAHLADDAVDSDELAAGAVDAAHLAADVITGAKIADDAIDSEHYTDGSIDTAHIGNDQVTGAKLNPSLVLGDIIYADGTDTIARLAKGSATEVLTMGGSNAPTWAAASSGALVFIGTVEAQGGTGDPTIEVDGLDTSVYDYFEIQFAGITPISDNVALQVRFGDSGGIDSGASDYAWAKTRFDESATASAGSDTSDSLISIAHALGNQTTEGYSGTIYINTGDLSCHTTLYGIGTVKVFTGTISLFTCVGQRFSNLTLTQVQIFMNSGNVQTGRMTVWGRKHA
jgi:hypothetical protein